MTTEFKIGDAVRKKGDKGQWHGFIVGTYSTKCTPNGYAVESVYEENSVQIYPASALEPWSRPAKAEDNKGKGDALRVIPCKKLFNADQASGFYAALDLMSGKITEDKIQEQPSAAALSSPAPCVDVEQIKWSTALAVAPEGNHTNLSGEGMVIIGAVIDHLASSGYLSSPAKYGVKG